MFLRAWRGLERFQERARFSTWLYRIAFNESQRRLSRRRPIPVDPEPSGEDPVTLVPDDPRSGPANQALDREFEAVLRDALTQLPAPWRLAVVLRDIEGLSTEEAAEVTGARPAAFKSRLHRGRMQLRTLLEPYLQLQDT